MNLRALQTGWHILNMPMNCQWICLVVVSGNVRRAIGKIMVSTASD
jgi:hypothetical protein